ncbi:MAG: hypothetical protein RR052_05355, partial [Oscillospiraceae bacterium]
MRKDNNSYSENPHNKVYKRNSEPALSEIEKGSHNAAYSPKNNDEQMSVEDRFADFADASGNSSAPQKEAEYLGFKTPQESYETDGFTHEIDGDAINEAMSAQADDGYIDGDDNMASQDENPTTYYDIASVEHAPRVRRKKPNKQMVALIITGVVLCIAVFICIGAFVLPSFLKNDKPIVDENYNPDLGQIETEKYVGTILQAGEDAGD